MTAALLALDAQLADAMTFILAVRVIGIRGEGNPSMSALYAAGGLGTVLAVKVGGAIVLALLAWRLAPSRWALLPAIVGLAGAASNVAALA